MFTRLLGGLFFLPFAYQLDVFGLYLDGGGEVALFQIDEDALGLAAALAHQATFQAVETTADDADALAVKPGGDLLETEVLGVVATKDGLDEGAHGLGTYRHGLVLLASTDVTVLQQLNLIDHRVQLLPALMNEDKVGHERDGTDHPSAILVEDMLLEGHEDEGLQLGHVEQQTVSGSFGIGTRKVTQYVPLGIHTF